MTLSAPFGGTCPIPFVPLGHFPLIRGIGLAMTGFFDNLEGTANGCPFLYHILLFLNKFPSPIV